MYLYIPINNLTSEVGRLRKEGLPASELLGAELGSIVVDEHDC